MILSGMSILRNVEVYGENLPKILLGLQLEAFEGLELYAVKIARTVLRRRGLSNEFLLSGAVYNRRLLCWSWAS